MAEIRVRPLGSRQLHVELRDGAVETSHGVTVPDRLQDGPDLREHDLERAVRDSFAFLLEREPASSILAQFSLSDITRYFPEYPGDLARRLS